MRWLLLNHNLRGRGTWHRAWGFARELARRGDAVELWTAAPHHYYRPARETVDGVRIVETPGWAPLARGDDGWGPLDCAWRLGRAVLAPCDAVLAFAHPPNVFLPAWLLARLRGKPLVYDWCDWYAGGIFPKREALRRAGLGDPHERPLQRWAERREVCLERAMPRLAAGVTVISEKLRELALGLGCPPERVLRLPNGAALETLPAPGGKAACRAALGLPPEGLWLAYIANYHPDEEFFLRALARAAAIRASAGAPPFRLLKTGPPFSARLTAALGLDAVIHDLARAPEAHLPLILGAADALALPLEENASNAARLPFKFGDYLAAARPQAACRVGDVAMYFERAERSAGRIGIASAPRIDEYGAALAALPDAPDRDAMGRAARAFAEAEFNWTRLTERLIEFTAGLK